jgi:hypothetical protein
VAGHAAAWAKVDELMVKDTKVLEGLIRELSQFARLARQRSKPVLQLDVL